MRNINELNILDKEYFVFDLDGTLIDSVGIWNLVDQQMIKLYGNVDVDEFLIQKERDSYLKEHKDKNNYLDYINFISNKYNFLVNNIDEIIKIRQSILNNILRNGVKFKPGVDELIKFLKGSGCILILATMTTKKQLNIYANENRNLFEKLDIYNSFDLIISKEDVLYDKPNPEIYNKIIDYYQKPREKFIVFEDSLAGIIACNEAGLEVINVYDKYSDYNREKINKLADYSINSYNEIKALFNK